MKIVELVNSLEVGGTERLVVDLARSFTSKGHEVTVVCLRGGGALERPLHDAGIAVAKLQKGEGPSFGALRQFARLLREGRVDVVHSHNPLVHHYAVAGGRLAGTAVVVNTIHGLGNLDTKIGLKEVLYSGMSWLSSAIVAVCPMAYREFKRRGVIPARRLVAINNGIPLESFVAVTPRAADSTTVFGIVGRLVPVKDHRTLLQAFQTVLTSHPTCRLEILGDGPERDALEQQAQSLGIAGHVIFRGYSSDVPAFLRGIDVSVLCSVSEGLPLGVLESMAAGLPIVGTDVGGMRDLIEGAQCGWLTPAGDPHALAQAMMRAVEVEPQERRAMGVRARAHVISDYSLERMTDQYDALFRRLAAR